MNPVRYPDVSSRPLMTKRAWWLVGLNILVPGSAQVLAGDRRLGRFALRTTFALWIFVAVSIGLVLLARAAAITVFTNPIALGILVAVFVFYAVLWLVLSLDTLRLVRLVRVEPRRRAFIATLSVVAMVVAVGGAGAAAANGVSAIGLFSSVFGGGQWAAPIDGRYNILLLGGDAGADRMGLRPDSISVASVDANTGQVVLLGIPRNLYQAQFVKDSPLWEDFPDGYTCGDDCLISFLYTYGEEHPDLYPEADAHGSNPGVEAMRDAVEGVLGITLQYYALIDMSGFSGLIDALGGVDITVTERLPINGGMYNDGTLFDVEGWIEPGEQHMNGYTALWYARSRHSTSDYDRMARQRQLQEAILKQMEPANVLTKFQGIAAASSQVVKTDIPQVMLGHFVDLAVLAKSQAITSYDFVPDEWDNLNPDFDAIHAKVAELLSPATPTPSAEG